MPIFGLEKLCLCGSNISDGTALVLASALRHNHILKSLDLRYDTVITSSDRDDVSVIVNAAWRDLFAGLLQYAPTCMLESGLKYIEELLFQGKEVIIVWLANDGRLGVESILKKLQDVRWGTHSFSLGAYR